MVVVVVVAVVVVTAVAVATVVVVVVEAVVVVAAAAGLSTAVTRRISFAELASFEVVFFDAWVLAAYLKPSEIAHRQAILFAQIVSVAVSTPEVVASFFSLQLALSLHQDLSPSRPWDSPSSVRHCLR